MSVRNRSVPGIQHWLDCCLFIRPPNSTDLISQIHHYHKGGDMTIHQYWVGEVPSFRLGVFIYVFLFISLKSPTREVFLPFMVTVSNWDTGIPTQVCLTLNPMLYPPNDTAVLKMSCPRTSLSHSVTTGISPSLFTCKTKRLAQEAF